MTEENKNVEEKIENQEEVKSEEKKEEEEFLSPGVSGPGKGVLEKIAGIFKGSKKTVEDAEDTKETDELDEAEDGDETKTDEKPEYDEIDPRFISAAREYGWNDQRIIDYAESHSDEDILTMVSLLQDTVKKTQQESKDDEQVKDELFDEETLSKYAEDFNVSKDTIRGIAKTMTGPLADRLNSVSSELDTIKGSLGKREEDEQLKEIARNTEIANDIFDKSKFSSLGKTKDIPKYPDGSYVMNDPTFQERGKVWDVAQSFYAAGGTWEHAMENAMQWYRGTSAEKEVKRNVIKDLKEQEERVMPKRQEQHGAKTYATEEERKAAIINDAVAKYNVEYPS